ncbi:type IV pilin protein [Iodobacter ciconiae]|uniref:Type II secretion system protein n=1 Tax=Iodobacter ciconiae TaxID=2496266 RepID=A0A3S8ZPT6_9NEIS|nr:type II secretion system protein [Iodobacter ciconiae]AZN35477.1 type II secretion system protein [Iodobacter ciconiae]
MRPLPKGFTLIEMLIVMAIVALLLTIALPRYFGSLEKSKDVALQENLKVLRLSLDRFYSDKGHYPQTLGELVEYRYLKTIPIDPITESSSSWILIPARDADTPGISDIKSGASGLSQEGYAYDVL